MRHGTISDVCAKAYLIHHVADIFLEVTTDVAKERDVANSRNHKQQRRSSKDDDSEGGCDRQDRSGHVVIGEVLGNIPPTSRLRPLGKEDTVERECIDGLTRCISEQNTLPA